MEVGCVVGLGDAALPACAGTVAHARTRHGQGAALCQVRQMPETDMSLGALLKTKRNALGMTLDEVAEAAGMSKSHLHGLEGDKCEPGIVLCAKLSVALGLPVQAMASAALTGALQNRGAKQDA